MRFRGRFFRYEITFANERGIDLDFDRGYATIGVGTLHQSLADDGAQNRRELQANLLLLGRREDGDDTVDGFDRVQSV